MCIYVYLSSKLFLLLHHSSNFIQLAIRQQSLELYNKFIFHFFNQESTCLHFMRNLTLACDGMDGWYSGIGIQLNISGESHTQILQLIGKLCLCANTHTVLLIWFII